MKNLFKKISMKVHPDIVGNTELNNERMREVLKYRTNAGMLEELACKWGLEIDGRVYAAPENFIYFRTILSKIYAVKPMNNHGRYINVTLKTTFDDVGWSNESYHNDEAYRRFDILSLMKNVRYDLYRDTDILVKTPKVFKMYGLVRTTKKCVFVIDNGKEKRYNMTSVIGRRVEKTNDNKFIWR